MIPKFNLNGTLPPFKVGSNPTERDAVAPYETTSEDLVVRFAINDERWNILRGLFSYRAALRNIGIESGYQWIDGSFVEDCETSRSRPPGDVDIVTFAYRPINVKDLGAWEQLVNANLSLFLPEQSKAQYHCDAYFVDLELDPLYIVNQTAYWFGLFSHQRASQLWKGMLMIPLEADDSAAIAWLNGGLNNAP